MTLKVLSQFEFLSFVTIWAFEFCHHLVFEFCHHLNFLVLPPFENKMYAKNCKYLTQVDMQPLLNKVKKKKIPAQCLLSSMSLENGSLYII